MENNRATKTETMEKAKITDYNICEFDMDKQTEIKNGVARFDFSDCYFTVRQSEYDPSTLVLQKIGKRHPNTDQISVKPNSTNLIYIS